MYKHNYGYHRNHITGASQVFQFLQTSIFFFAIQTSQSKKHLNQSLRVSVSFSVLVSHDLTNWSDISCHHLALNSLNLGVVMVIVHSRVGCYHEDLLVWYLLHDNVSLFNDHVVPSPHVCSQVAPTGMS